jgi:hypothetical protein
VTSADAAVRSGILHSAGQGAQQEAGQAGQVMPRGRWFPESVTVTARMSAALAGLWSGHSISKSLLAGVDGAHRVEPVLGEAGCLLPHTSSSCSPVC